MPSVDKRGEIVCKATLIVVFLVGVALLLGGLWGNRQFEAAGFNQENAFSLVHQLTGETDCLYQKKIAPALKASGADLSAVSEVSRALLLSAWKTEEPLKATLQAYEKAAGDERFGAQAMRDTLMMQILIQVGRMSAASAPEAAFDPKIAAALSYINEHLSEELTVDILAEQVYLSRYHFMRLFKAQTGSTAHAYVRQKRLLLAARLIREGVPVGKAAADCGFGDYSAFHRAFRESFGLSPGELKK